MLLEVAQEEASGTTRESSRQEKMGAAEAVLPMSIREVLDHRAMQVERVRWAVETLREEVEEGFCLEVMMERLRKQEMEAEGLLRPPCSQSMVMLADFLEVEEGAVILVLMAQMPGLAVMVGGVEHARMKKVGTE